jgi:phosphate starvation-inducible PhoH-like protein
MTPNQQILVDMMNKNDMVFAVGPAGTGKTYTGVAMAVKALKRTSKKNYSYTTSCRSRRKFRFPSR